MPHFVRQRYASCLFIICFDDRRFAVIYFVCFGIFLSLVLVLLIAHIVSSNKKLNYLKQAITANASKISMFEDVLYKEVKRLQLGLEKQEYELKCLKSKFVSLQKGATDATVNQHFLDYKRLGGLFERGICSKTLAQSLQLSRGEAYLIEKMSTHMGQLEQLIQNSDM